MSVRVAILALLALAHAWSSPARAQPGPLGPQFVVNTTTTDNQIYPRIAADASGDFIVVFMSGAVSLDYNTLGQRFDASAAPLGTEFNASTSSGHQVVPGVATDAAGNFVVVWHQGFGQDGFFYGVFGRRFDSSGVPQGMEFQVNTYTTGAQMEPAIASDASGNFIVVWSSVQDGSGFGVFGQRYDASGSTQGAEFQVNTQTIGNQGKQYSTVHDGLSVGLGATGEFVVVWASNYGDGDGYGVFGRRFDSSGTPLGNDFQVNTYTTGSQSSPAVGVTGDGQFVVTWTSYDGQDGNGPGIFGQRYDAAGMQLGTEFQVNTTSSSVQRIPNVACDSAGNSLVVWEGSSAEDPFGVVGRLYDADGDAIGVEFQVNDYTTGNQFQVSGAAQSAGDFVITWFSDYVDGSSWGIAARQFSLSASTSSTTSTTSSSTSSTTSTTSTTLPTTDLLPGRIALIKPATLVKFVAKPLTDDTFAPPFGNPVADGGALRIYDSMSTAGDETYNLPAGAAWKGLGSPAGSKGYKYKGAGTPSDPCKVVLIKTTVIKAVCKGSGISLAPPFDGEVGIELSLGTTDRYCASFGGDNVKNDGTLTKRKNAPAPGACP